MRHLPYSDCLAFWLTLLRLAVLLLVSCFLPMTKAQDDSGFKYLEVQVVDSDGKPLADVPVNVKIDGAEFPMPTDKQGLVSFNVPTDEKTRLTLKVMKPGFVALGAEWKKGQKIPDKFTIPLRKGIEIGGIVHDEQGQPIEGVQVEAGIFYQDTYGPNKKIAPLRPMLRDVIATTDSTGRWSFDSAPSAQVNMQFKFSHADFVSRRGYSRHGWSWEQLQAQDQVLVMENGVEIKGHILDPDGQPIAGAQIAVGSSRFDSARQIVTTNQAGEYQLSKQYTGTIILTVSSPDWAPEMRIFTSQAETQNGSVDIQLQPPQTVRIRVVDPDGQPLPGVTIIPENWRGYRSLEDPFGRKQTDDEGIWEWRTAPVDEVQYSIFARGRFSFADSRAGFLPSDEVQDIVMYPAAIVTGNVIDKATRQPIETFNYVEGVWWDVDDTRYILQRTSGTKLGQDGLLRFEMNDGCIKYLIHVEAKGYQPSRSREILPEEGSVHLEFELEPSKNISGVVKLPSGEPAVGAEVVVATPERGVYPYNGRVTQLERFPHAFTDEQGRYTVSAVEAGFIVVYMHDLGVAQLTEAEHEATNEVILQPWARVEGRVMPGAKMGPAPQAFLKIPGHDLEEQEIAKVTWYYRKPIDKVGDFAFERVPALPAVVGSSFLYGDPGRQSYYEDTHTKEQELTPGETATVQIGGTGVTIKGQLTMPVDFRGEIPWHRGSVKLTEQAKSAASPIHRKIFAATIAADGSFEINDVLAGKYDFSTSIFDVSVSGERWRLLAKAEQSCIVPEEQAGATTPVVDLGKIDLELVSEE